MDFVAVRKSVSAQIQTSPQKVPGCYSLLNIIHCAICYSVNETAISAMLQSISGHIFMTFHSVSGQVADIRVRRAIL